jgi:hypothetical protein
MEDDVTVPTTSDDVTLPTAMETNLVSDVLDGGQVGGSLEPRSPQEGLGTAFAKRQGIFDQILTGPAAAARFDDAKDDVGDADKIEIETGDRLTPSDNFAFEHNPSAKSEPAEEGREGRKLFGECQNAFSEPDAASRLPPPAQRQNSSSGRSGSMGVDGSPNPAGQFRTCSEDEAEDSWDEDSVPLFRRGDPARSSLSIPSPDSTRLSPISGEPQEPGGRRYSTDTVPSRWRRAPSFSSQPASYAASRSSVTRDDHATSNNDGVFRSKSAHLFYREPSPKTSDFSTSGRKSSFSTADGQRNIYATTFAAKTLDFSSQKNDKSPTSKSANLPSSKSGSFSLSRNDSQRSLYSPGAAYTPSSAATMARPEVHRSTPEAASRDRRATSVAGLTYPPPPSLPPPPLPGAKFSGLERKFRSTENVEALRAERSARPQPLLRPTPDTKVGYATLRTTTNASSADKIPSRFRRARDHAAAASNPDVSKKPPEFPTGRSADLHEQVRIAKMEHQRCCDEAKSFDAKRALFAASRSKSFSSLAGPGAAAGAKHAAPGPGSGLPPNSSNDSSLRRPIRFSVR